MTEPMQSAPSAETEAAYLAKLKSRPRLRRDQARDYLELEHNYRVTIATMAKWKVVGGGPPIQYINGTPFYTPATLDAWIEKKLQGAA
jgi:hypothetical protein